MMITKFVMSTKLHVAGLILTVIGWWFDTTARSAMFSTEPRMFDWIFLIGMLMALPHTIRNIRQMLVPQRINGSSKS